MNRPCLGCGRLIAKGSRCSVCTPRRDRPKNHPHTNTTRWKKLSATARRQQPWCLDCGTTEYLCADHIIPVAERPDLAYEELNITVRCRTCNGRRADHCTDADRNQVLAAIAARAKSQSSSRAPSQPGLHQALITRVS
ncbi:HNH endonuclease [Mycobacteroides abscessus]|uniref:HNH endonuclease n=1 Tax=Mycobacteroides abscessus TaxID=36809 RepID=UPI0034DD2126